jgi:prepilin-type N-terminal cleavage/methylation domain-containing protein
MNNKRRNLFYKNGFTLIELVVVFTVIAILSTIGTVSFVSYSRAQVLNQTTSDLVQALDTAKSLSASQLKSLNKNGKKWRCLDYQTLNGYGIQIDTSDTSHEYYFLYMKCATINGATIRYPDANNVSDWQTNLPQNVTFDPTTNITDVFFPVLSGGIITTPTAGSSNADTIALSSYGNIKTINLTNGYISISP